MIPLAFLASHETGFWEELEMPGNSVRELQSFPAARRAWERLSSQNPELAQGHHLGFCFCEWFQGHIMSSSLREFLSKMNCTFFIVFLKLSAASFSNISKVQGMGHLKRLPSEMGKAKWNYPCFSCWAWNLKTCRANRQGCWGCWDTKPPGWQEKIHITTHPEGMCHCRSEQSRG